MFNSMMSDNTVWTPKSCKTLTNKRQMFLWARWIQNGGALVVTIFDGLSPSHHVIYSTQYSKKFLMLLMLDTYLSIATGYEASFTSFMIWFSPVTQKWDSDAFIADNTNTKYTNCIISLWKLMWCNYSCLIAYTYPFYAICCLPDGKEITISSGIWHLVEFACLPRSFEATWRWCRCVAFLTCIPHSKILPAQGV